MTVKLVINSTSPADVAALSHAARVAKRLHDDLFVFSVMPRPETAVVFTGIDGSVAMASVAGDAARKLQDERRQLIDELFTATLGREGVPETAARLEHFVEFPAYQTIREAVLARPLIFPHTAAAPNHELSIAFRRVLMDAALPVVLASSVPRDLSTIVIAWDGSAEASRAVRFHLPMIKAHDRAIIVQNPDDISEVNTGPHTDPIHLQKWLSAHQVPADISTFDGKVAGGLLQIAKDADAGMIVSSAYGHSRIGEFLFGGATRGLLKSDDGPALALSH